MVTYTIVLMTQAQKDAKKIQSAGFKDKTLKLIKTISQDPLQYPPEFEYLKGEMLHGKFNYYRNSH